MKLEAKQRLMAANPKLELSPKSYLVKNKNLAEIVRKYESNEPLNADDRKILDFWVHQLATQKGPDRKQDYANVQMLYKWSKDKANRIVPEASLASKLKSALTSLGWKLHSHEGSKNWFSHQSFDHAIKDPTPILKALKELDPTAKILEDEFHGWDIQGHALLVQPQPEDRFLYVVILTSSTRNRLAQGLDF